MTEVDAMPVIPGLEALELVGKGATGVVYRAHQATFDRPVAVKVLGRLDDPYARARFEREMRTIGRLSSFPGIVTVFDAGVLPDDTPYLVMEYLPRTLLDAIDAEGTIPWSDAARVGAQVAEALEYVHANGVLHRDIKPGNIFLTDDGEALVGDFGVATELVGADEHERAFTPGYVAPEVAAGEPGDPRSDVYSLAATLYTAVVGETPFGGGHDSVVTLLAEVVRSEPPAVPEALAPAAFRDIVARGLRRTPDARYSTALDMARALRRALHLDLVPGPGEAAGVPGERVEGALDLRLKPGFRFVQSARAVDDVLPWLGHDALVQRLLDRLLHADGGAYLLTGFRGVGKSTVVSRAIQRARTDPRGEQLVVLHLNLARPLASPHLLLVDATRQLFEWFFETDQLDELGDIARRCLELAYVRTSALLSHTSSRSEELGMTLGILKGLDVSAKRADSHAVQQAFQAYTEADVEHDFLRFTRLLLDEAGRRRRKRFGRDEVVPPRRVVIVLDEIDKLTATEEGRTYFEDALRSLKNVLSAPSVHFVFVAGPDLHDEFTTQGRRGNSVIESIFSLHLYVPVLWQAAPALLPQLLDPDDLGTLPPAITDGLRYRSAGVLRRLVQQLNDLVVWDDAVPTLRLSRPELELLELQGEVDRAVLAAVAVGSDGIPGTIEDDRARLATYVLVQWILTGARPEVSESEIRRAMTASPAGGDSTDLQIADEALRFTTDRIGDLLDSLTQHGVLERSVTWARPGVPTTYWLERDLRRRLVRLEQLPRGTNELRPLPPYGDDAVAPRLRPPHPPLPPPEPAPPPQGYDPPAPQAGPSPWPTGPAPAPPRAAAGAAPSPPYAAAQAGVTFLPWSPPPSSGTGAPMRSELAHGRYVLEEVIGHGGFGTVYRARDRVEDREVAARVLEEVSMVDHAGARQRFLREARLVQRLVHPAIFRAVDVLEEPDGRLAVIAEMTFGRPLDEVVREGPVAPAEAVAITGSLLDAVSYLHAEGISRITLTAESIVLQSDGTPVITDLGAARSYGSDRATITGAGDLAGSFPYLAPELLEGEPPSVRSDVYAVGMLTYQLLGGTLPWTDDTPLFDLLRHKRAPLVVDVPGVSPALLEVIRRATALDPLGRYDDARQMAEALAAAHATSEG